MLIIVIIYSVTKRIIFNFFYIKNYFTVKFVVKCNREHLNHTQHV